MKPGPLTLKAWPVVALLATVMGVVAITAALFLKTAVRMDMIDAERVVTLSGKLSLEHLLSLAKDLETGARGFALTGQPAFLQPYNQAVSVLPTTYQRARALVDVPWPENSQGELIHQLLDQLEGLTDNIISWRREIRSLPQFYGRNPLLDQGRDIMDRLREAITQLEALQDARLDTQGAELSRLREKAIRLSWGVSLSTLAFVSLALVLFFRERGMRMRLEMRLRDANQVLENRVAERTQALQEARNQIRQFAANQEQAIEQERRALSREVHDQIGQVFTTIKLIVDQIPENLFSPGQKEALNQAMEIGIASARRITARLRPPLLDHLGLQAALEYFGQQWTRQAGLAFAVDVRDHENLKEEQALALFRIVQEAATNVVRHAQANGMSLKGHAGQGQYVLEITDDGKGLDESRIRPGALGMVGMRERALILGGTLEVGSNQGQGTRLRVVFPLENTQGI